MTRIKLIVILFLYQFQRSNYPNNSKDAIRRVFAFRGISIDNPNPPTKMQRAIQAIIKDGNSIANGAIFIPKQ